MSGPLPFIVIRLAETAPVGNDLRKLAQRAGYRGLASLLREHPAIAAERVIRNVTPQKLLRLEQRARDSDYPPRHSLTSFWRLDFRRLPKLVDRLIRRLNDLPEIGLAYREAPVSAPAQVLSPANNPRFVDQTYLDLAPVGVGVAAAWMVADGSGIRFADVEKSWLLGHEDLFGAGPAPAPLHGVNDMTLATSAHHGAAVLGIVVARHNTIGTIGMAPGVTSISISSHSKGPNDDFHVSAAIMAAINGPLRPGDVLLLEVQRDANRGVGNGKWVATEFDNADFTAIRLASALGVIVVEAAGTAADPEPAFDLAGLAPFNPASGSFQGDSGAIMVAGSKKAVPHERAPSSNFGARVNCYAWGEDVATLSGGTDVGGEIKGDGTPAAASTSEKVRYTRQFGGSSAAAAIVAGAAILVQDVYRLGSLSRPTGGRLSPRRMRNLLCDPATSTARAPTTDAIGRMPDLGLLVAALDAVPDLYIRDDVGDDGSVPSVGTVSVSPDVVVSKTMVTPAAAFAAGGTEVERGHDNFVYVRVSNRNAVAAPGAEVRVYWGQVATLMPPSTWKPLNPPNPPLPAGAVPPADAVVNVPASSPPLAAPRITWLQANLPPSGHYCFVATVNHPLDPQPDLVTLTWDEFIAYIRNNNNVTWRNFQVVDLPVGGAPTPQPFIVPGAFDRKRVFDLQILQRRPRDVRVVWELPLSLFEQLPEAAFADVQIDEKQRRAQVRLQPQPKLLLRNVALNKSASHRCRFLITGTPSLSEALCTVAIGQLYEGTEVGRVTWRLRRR